MTKITPEYLVSIDYSPKTVYQTKMSFVWGKTHEGHEFWGKFHRILRGEVGIMEMDYDLFAKGANLLGEMNSVYKSYESIKKKLEPVIESMSRDELVSVIDACYEEKEND